MIDPVSSLPLPLLLIPERYLTAEMSQSLPFGGRQQSFLECSKDDKRPYADPCLDATLGPIDQQVVDSSLLMSWKLVDDRQLHVKGSKSTQGMRISSCVIGNFAVRRLRMNRWWE